MKQQQGLQVGDNGAGRESLSGHDQGVLDYIFQADGMKGSGNKNELSELGAALGKAQAVKVVTPHGAGFEAFRQKLIGKTLGIIEILAPEQLKDNPSLFANSVMGVGQAIPGTQPLVIGNGGQCDKELARCAYDNMVEVLTSKISLEDLKKEEIISMMFNPIGGVPENIKTAQQLKEEYIELIVERWRDKLAPNPLLFMPNLSFLDLSGLNLDGSDLSGCKLVGANFRGAKVNRANMKGSFLMAADFTDAELCSTSLVETACDGANFVQTKFSKSSQQPVENDTNFKGSNIHTAIIRDVDTISKPVLAAWEQVMYSMTEQEGITSENSIKEALKGELTEVLNNDFLKNSFKEYCVGRYLEIWGENFKDEQPDLCGVNLKGLDLTRFEMEGVLLMGTIINGARANDNRFALRMSLDGALTNADLSLEEKKTAVLDFIKSWKKSCPNEPVNLMDVDFPEGMDFSGVTFTNIDVTGARLRNAKFEGCDIEQCQFIMTDFSGSSFKNANLFKVDARKANFTDADLDGIIGKEFYVEEAKFDGAKGAEKFDEKFRLQAAAKEEFEKLKKDAENNPRLKLPISMMEMQKNAAGLASVFKQFLAKEKDTDNKRQLYMAFTMCHLVKGFAYDERNKLDLRGADFSGVNLTGFSFAAFDLMGADFTNAICLNAYFKHSILRDVKAQGMVASDSDFTGANVVGCNFTGAELRGAHFVDAVASEANFTNADMREAVCLRANFIQADLTRAKLQKANFTNAHTLGVILKGACIDKTIMTMEQIKLANYAGAVIDSKGNTIESLLEQQEKQERSVRSRKTRNKGKKVQQNQVQEQPKLTKEQLKEREEAAKNAEQELLDGEKKDEAKKAAVAKQKERGKQKNLRDAAEKRKKAAEEKSAREADAKRKSREELEEKIRALEAEITESADLRKKAEEEKGVLEKEVEQNKKLIQKIEGKIADVEKSKDECLKAFENRDGRDELKFETTEAQVSINISGRSYVFDRVGYDENSKTFLQRLQEQRGENNNLAEEQLPEPESEQDRIKSLSPTIEGLLKSAEQDEAMLGVAIIVCLDKAEEYVEGREKVRSWLDEGGKILEKTEDGTKIIMEIGGTGLLEGRRIKTKVENTAIFESIEAIQRQQDSIRLRNNLAQRLKTGDITKPLLEHKPESFQERILTRASSTGDLKNRGY